MRESHETTLSQHVKSTHTKRTPSVSKRPHKNVIRSLSLSLSLSQFTSQLSHTSFAHAPNLKNTVVDLKPKENCYNFGSQAPSNWFEFIQRKKKPSHTSSAHAPNLKIIVVGLKQKVKCDNFGLTSPSNWFEFIHGKTRQYPHKLKYRPWMMFEGLYLT